MSVVALDTMCVVWGLRSKPPTVSKELWERAQILFRMLEDNEATVLIPTIVVAELLAPIEPLKHGEFVSELNQRFMCPPFDLHASSIAAELWQRHRTLKRKDQTKRTTLKADVMIVATARSAGATVFYSHDRSCRRLAELANLEARDLPTHHENLFVDKEIRNSG